MPVTPAREWGLGHPTSVGGGPLFLLRPPSLSMNGNGKNIPYNFEQKCVTILS